MRTLGRLPGVSRVGMQQGRYAARTIERRVAGRGPLSPFHYVDKGSMADKYSAGCGGRRRPGWSTSPAQVRCRASAAADSARKTRGVGSGLRSWWRTCAVTASTK